MSKKRTILYALLAAAILLIPRASQLYTDYLWFETQQLASVFFTNLTYQVGLFIAAALIAYAALEATIRWSEHILKKEKKKYTRNPLTTPLLVLVSLLSASAYATQWQTVLRYANSYQFAATDPIFSNNIAYYVYTIPFYELIINFLSSVSVLAISAALILYALHYKKQQIPDVDEDIIESPQEYRGFQLKHYLDKIKEHAYGQLLILGSFVLLTTAATYYLQRYDLLTSAQGAVYGIGYTQALINLPGLWILTIASLVVTAILLLNIKKKNDQVIAYALIGLIALSVLVSAAAALTQGLVVEPDELNKERPYIEHEIQHTREAFALDRVAREDVQLQEELTEEQIASHPTTISNTRLWDDRPLLQTLNEIQIFRSYYTFPSIDVDRYDVDGQKRLLMLAAREIDISALEPQSQSWINRHLVYTHGFGAVLTSASEVTSANLPQLLVQDIPPSTETGINITQPRIYYGEQTTDYAIVNTQTAEHDYPRGEENVRINYPADGGVLLDNTIKQLAHAITFGAPQILFSGSIMPESRIQHYRQITQRAQKLAPYLVYDQDPYLVVADGQLYWIQDAYTTTNNYPYSRPITFNNRQANYIRNSAKVVINAYTGETTFYVSEEEDPLINTYQRAYPQLYKSMQEMPVAIQEHIRYPQDLFSAQGQRYQDYHMQDPTTFYNKEDSWRVPNEVVRGYEQELRPYYQLMKLPGEQEAEFIQVQPFIPRGRENLIGWLAARSDSENYGEIQAYHFSRQELTFGPMQVEGRIDQDTDISQQITLWSSAGSRVVRGNLLVIPIEESILYIEPLFLEAQEQGALPQLMRVIAVNGERIAMAPTLQGALNAITDPQAESTPIVQDPQAPVITDPQRIQEIREAYEQAQQAIDADELREYARLLEELEELLE